VTISTDELAALVALTRQKLEAAGELTPRRGPIRWDIPESVRDAIAEDIASGAFARALAEVTADDPEIQDQ
jgi:hypothetical protein